MSFKELTQLVAVFVGLNLLNMFVEAIISLILTPVISNVKVLKSNRLENVPMIKMVILPLQVMERNLMIIIMEANVLKRIKLKICK